MPIQLYGDVDGKGKYNTDDVLELQGLIASVAGTGSGLSLSGCCDARQLVANPALNYVGGVPVYASLDAVYLFRAVGGWYRFLEPNVTISCVPGAQSEG